GACQCQRPGDSATCAMPPASARSVSDRVSPPRLNSIGATALSPANWNRTARPRCTTWSTLRTAAVPRAGADSSHSTACPSDVRQTCSGVPPCIDQAWNPDAPITTVRLPASLPTITGISAPRRDLRATRPTHSPPGTSLTAGSGGSESGSTPINAADTGDGPPEARYQSAVTRPSGQRSRDPP